MNAIRSTLSIMALSAVFALAGCDREGPAERAGKSLDNTAEKIGDKAERAGDKMEDAAKDAKKEVTR